MPEPPAAEDAEQQVDHGPAESGADPAVDSLATSAPTTPTEGTTPTEDQPAATPQSGSSPTADISSEGITTGAERASASNETGRGEAAAPVDGDRLAGGGGPIIRADRVSDRTTVRGEQSSPFLDEHDEHQQDGDLLREHADLGFDDHDLDEEADAQDSHDDSDDIAADHRLDNDTDEHPTVAADHEHRLDNNTDEHPTVGHEHRLDDDTDEHATIAADEHSLAAHHEHQLDDDTDEHATIAADEHSLTADHEHQLHEDTDEHATVAADHEHRLDDDADPHAFDVQGLDGGPNPGEGDAAATDGAWAPPGFAPPLATETEHADAHEDLDDHDDPGFEPVVDERPAEPVAFAPPVPPEGPVPFEGDPLPMAEAPPAVIELRQIAGLTSGAIMELVHDTYDFAEGAHEVGFSLSVDENGRVIVIPGAATTCIDGAPVSEPTLLGSAVLDVGTARFIARPRMESPSATEQLARYNDVDQPEPRIIVPDDLVDVPESQPRARGLLRRKRNQAPPTEAANWEFMETIRDARSQVAARERFHHPDPAELALRVAHKAPNIGTRPFGHPLFATVSVMVADLPWLPDFDDIGAIPDSVGYQLQPLLSLPSVPVVADLMVGPLGIVGSRAAAMACARHLLVSLYAASTDDLRLHVVAATDQREAWEWSRALAPAAPLAMADNEQSVVLIDGMDLFPQAGFEHEDAIERRVSAVILAEAVDQLPAYCGTVLQIADAGTGILTNHRGDMIHGTPIGISTSIAEGLATDLVPLVRQRRR